MQHTFTGTRFLVRLALRQDRWLLPLWLGGFAMMAGSAAATGKSLYPDAASRFEAATALNATGSMVALFGRVYDPASLGALSLIKYTAFMTAALAVLMAFVTTRHTRSEEESGRVELLGGGQVGRSAPLAAALLVSFGASAAVGLLTGAALVAGGLPARGSFAFGMGWAATGIAFSAVAGVTAQLTTSDRSALGLASVVIAGTYALRAVGDLAQPGPSALSWLSPIGWNQQVRAFAGDRWWVLALPLTLTAVLVPLGFALRSRRDLGGGLRQPRPGPAEGRLTGVLALAVRLQGRVLAAWAAAFTVFGVVIGSLVANVGDLLSSPNAQDLVARLGGSGALTDAFLAAEIAIMGVLAAAYGIASTSHLRGEETTGRTELLLASGTSRGRWATSHVTAALGGIVVLMLLAGLGIGVGAALSLHDAGQVGRAVLAAMAQVPAAWLVTSAVVATFGWLPRGVSATWGLFAGFVAIGEFGELWGAPPLVRDLSPFTHAPLLPVTADALPTLLALGGTAAALAALGYAGWLRRDLAS